MLKMKITLVLLALLLTGCFLVEEFEEPEMPTPRPAAGADLVVTGMGMTLDPNVSCLSDDTLSGTVVSVENIGDANARPFTVSVTTDTGTTWTENVTGLAAGERIAVFVVGGWSTGETRAVADAEDTVPESDETNNSLALQLPMPTPYVRCTPTP